MGREIYAKDLKSGMIVMSESNAVVESVSKSPLGKILVVFRGGKTKVYSEKTKLKVA